MNEPYWLPRTLEEYRQQLAEDNGPQPDEMVRLQRALDAAEGEVARLQSERAAWRKTADLVEQQRDRAKAERDDALARLAAAEAVEKVLRDGLRDLRDYSVSNWFIVDSTLAFAEKAALDGSREHAQGEGQIRFPTPANPPD